MQLQQTEIAVATTSPAEHDWYRGAVRRLARLDPVWLAVLACYVAVFGGILVYSNFLPYTFDNNESFSAFWHARNMYEYGIANSSGLADESFSYDPASHPYVYTHAGASPRLFAYLLYVLGIRTIELQIAVTVFSVGLLAFWFAYRFLAEISTRLYATIACLLLMTDYIMFVQWHVGAWHVWKMFLLFGGLYLAQRVAARKQAYPLLVVYAFHAFLFYYETIFNVYVAAAVFLYFVFASRDYRFALKFGVAQFAGALTAAAILLGQLVLQFGWDVVRTDIYYTFIGRNFAADPAAFLEAARAFYADHNIVFWLNVPDSSSYRNLLWAFRMLFQDHAVHTPPWSLIVLAFAGAEVVRRLRSAPSFAPARPNSVTRVFEWPRKLLAHVDWKLLVKDATLLAPFVLVTLSVAIFYVLANHPEIGIGLAPLSSFWIFELLPILAATGILVVVIAFRRPLQARALSRPRKIFARDHWKRLLEDETSFALILVLTLSAAGFHFLSKHPEVWAGLATLSRFWISAWWPMVIGVGILLATVVISVSPTLFGHPGRILAASAFLTAVLAFLLVQPSLYAGTGALDPIWRAVLTNFAEYTTRGALFVTAMLVLAAWYASGPVAATGRSSFPEVPPDRLIHALAALLLSYLVVYFLFTGYVFTGYFARHLSLTVFLDDLVLALGLVAMIDCARGAYARFAQSIGWQRLAHGSGAAIAACGLFGVVLAWGSLQIFLLRKLPPDEISFFPILSKPPFRGSTFAASIYGGTLSYFNNNWAYYDANSALAEGGVTLGPDGYDVKRDDAYVWFADRAVNKSYNKPEYFLAMTFQFHATTRGLGPSYLMDDEVTQRPRAGDIPLVRAVREGRTSYLHPVEVARDSSPLDRWSILRLDWDFPPFLRGLEGGEFVTLEASPAADGTRIRVDYRYAHQEGVPETGTRVTLFARARCADPEQWAALSPAGVHGHEFILPSSFAGMVRAEVQPATATKVGPAYASRPLQIGSQEPCAERSSMSK
jgi:hypothetical protein